MAISFNSKIHIKRIIAVGGDWIDISKEGVVTVNGNILDEPYVTEQSIGKCDLTFPFFVEADNFFVMGDNRPVSMDSRDSRFGLVSREQIIGRVKLVIWPLNGIKKTK